MSDAEVTQEDLDMLGVAIESIETSPQVTRALMNSTALFELTGTPPEPLLMAIYRRQLTIQQMVLSGIVITEAAPDGAVLVRPTAKCLFLLRGSNAEELISQVLGDWAILQVN